MKFEAQNLIFWQEEVIVKFKISTQEISANYINNYFPENSTLNCLVTLKPRSSNLPVCHKASATEISTNHKTALKFQLLSCFEIVSEG